MSVSPEQRAAVIASAAEAGAVPCGHIINDGWCAFFCGPCVYTDAASRALAAFFAATCGWMGVR